MEKDYRGIFLFWKVGKILDFLRGYIRKNEGKLEVRYLPGSGMVSSGNVQGGVFEHP